MPKFIKTKSLLLVLFLMVVKVASAQHSEDLNLGKMVAKVPLDAIYAEKDNFVWCGSMVKGPDSLFHLFYSRWPKKLGHSAWATHSEIAHAVANKANGPYVFKNVVLKARGNKFWDGAATHNPTVIFRDNKYYLYYMGTTGTANLTYPISMKDTAWWDYRNHQRIGVAIATKPDGKWKRYNKPVLGTSNKENAYDGLMVSNPAVTFGKNNQVVMLYKQVEDNNTLKGGKVKFGVAFSNSPKGPFKKEPNPVFENNVKQSEWMTAEDPYLWYQNGTYFSIVRDVVGNFTGVGGALALLTSKDAKEWFPAKNPMVLSKSFMWENGKDSNTKLERPQLYLENGVPKILFGAVDDNSEGYRKYSYNIRIPLQ